MFRQNPSSGSRVVAGGQTEIRDKANNHFFWNFANAPKKVNVAKYDKLEEAIAVWTENFNAKDIRAIGGVANDRPKMICK
jgi:hypothetical protein